MADMCWRSRRAADVVKAQGWPSVYLDLLEDVAHLLLQPHGVVPAMLHAVHDVAGHGLEGDGERLRPQGLAQSTAAEDIAPARRR
jgi:hypothetical protein